MAGNPHPFQQPYANRDASALLSAEKQYNRKTIADTNAIANGDWTGQYAGLHLLSDNSDWDMDASDTTTASDHVNFERDANGILFKRVQPTITVTSKLITATGNVTIVDDEAADEIEINNTSGAPVTVYLPDATVRAKAITVTDVGINAGTYPITVTRKAATSQTIMGGTQYVIDSNGGGIKLTPNSAKTGYK